MDQGKRRSGLFMALGDARKLDRRLDLTQRLVTFAHGHDRLSRCGLDPLVARAPALLQRDAARPGPGSRLLLFLGDPSHSQCRPLLAEP
jgi:hypothetical protein